MQVNCAPDNFMESANTPSILGSREDHVESFPYAVKDQGKVARCVLSGGSATVLDKIKDEAELVWKTADFVAGNQC